VVTASEDQTAKVWDATTGQLRASLEGHTKRVYTAVFSPDGTRAVTVSEDQTAKLWDVTTGQILLSLEGHIGKEGVVAFSPDGARLVTASDDGTVRVWDVSLETRSPAEVAAFVRCKGTWRLEDGRLLPATPEPTACPARTAAQ
jgi:WD40 repeat protein